jgi:hypothetical protein
MASCHSIEHDRALDGLTVPATEGSVAKERVGRVEG